jgi:hypothetical protein
MPVSRTTDQALESDGIIRDLAGVVRVGGEDWVPAPVAPTAAVGDEDEATDCIGIPAEVVALERESAVAAWAAARLEDRASLRY